MPAGRNRQMPVVTRFTRAIGSMNFHAKFIS